MSVQPETETNHGGEETEQLNQGDNVLGIDLQDECCPDCGREIQRTVFSYQAYCPVCDTIWGRIKQFLSLTNNNGD